MDRLNLVQDLGMANGVVGAFLVVAGVWMVYSVLPRAYQGPEWYMVMALILAGGWMLATGSIIFFASVRARSGWFR